MKKLLSLMLLTLLIASCATEKNSPAGVVRKINSQSKTSVYYSGSNNLDGTKAISGTNIIS